MKTGFLREGLAAGFSTQQLEFIEKHLIEHTHKIDDVAGLADALEEEDDSEEDEDDEG